MGRTLGCLELLCLARPSNTTREPPERNDLLVVGNIGEVGVGLGQFKACCAKYRVSPRALTNVRSSLRTSKSSGNLPHVLEVGAQVLPASF